jgi:hypothetical protein
MVTMMLINKFAITLMVIYFIGDPTGLYLNWLGDVKVYLIAAAVSIVSLPWVASIFDS